MPLKNTSARESSLEALKAVLQGVDGIKTVVRHGQDERNISDAQLPAVIILDKKAKYTRFNDLRQHEINYSVDLVLLARARRTASARHGDVGTVRELFSHTVINTLIHNPQLYVQLEGEAEADNHCSFVGDVFDVEYEETLEFPYASATISFNIKLVTAFNDLPLEDWTELAIDIAPADETGEAEASSVVSATDTLPDDGIKTVVVTS